MTIKSLILNLIRMIESSYNSYRYSYKIWFSYNSYKNGGAKTYNRMKLKFLIRQYEKHLFEVLKEYGNNNRIKRCLARCAVIPT